MYFEKKIIIALSTASISLLLFSCNNETQSNNNSDTQDQHIEKDNKTNNTNNTENKEKNKQSTVEKSDNKKRETKPKDNNSIKKEDNYLKNLSQKQIEYARVWEQLGPMKNEMEGMDSLYVKEITKGSKVNPKAKNSAVYKENVVKLEAPMKAGGSVTYSSNGDGTINVYKNIPYKWASPQSSDYKK